MTDQSDKDPGASVAEVYAERVDINITIPGFAITCPACQQPSVTRADQQPDSMTRLFEQGLSIMGRCACGQRLRVRRALIQRPNDAPNRQQRRAMRKVNGSS